MRQFKIYNAIGQEYDLNDPGSFFHDPNGLGFKSDEEFERIGRQFLLTEEGVKQPEPEGKIRFKDYACFNKFAQFLQRQPLKLMYKAADTYYMDVRVREIEKTELEALGLIVEAKFSGLGPWYKEVTRNIDGPEAVGKVYAYTYPYVYADNSQGVIKVESDSELESPMIITIIGPCSNLEYVQYVNGKVAASGKILYDIPDGRRVKISSKIPYSIKELDALGNETADLYQYSDFSTERFLMVRQGMNEIAFSHEGEEEIKAVVEAEIYYDTI